MAIDPNIALGVRPIEIANPVAQYGQIAQIQNAQNQNALAQYQLGAAQRQEATQNALSEAYKSSFNPDTGKIDEAALLKGLAERGAGHLIPDVQTKLLASQKELSTINKNRIDTESAQFKLEKDKLSHGLESLTSAPTPQDAIQKLNDGVSKGFFDMKTASAEAQKLQNMTPQEYQKYRIEKIMGLVDAKDRLGYMLPKIKQQEAGGSILAIQDNPMLPGYGLPIANMAIKKTATIGELTGQARLNLERQKFDFEKANPGYELKEDADGNFFGVNKRTLQAIPVTVGGGAVPTAAPAAAPMVPSAGGMPGPRVAQPGAVVPAIPGMTSVLDQTMPAAAPAVAPSAGGPRQLVGKGTALTESQGAAAAYGMRMKEANSILNPLEKRGVKDTGLISGVVGGTLGIVPYLGDKLEGMSGSIFNALPQILGGLSPEQQQVAQARINFITAVLRKESGASISPSEFTTAEKNYFPKPGDDATVVAQKQKARDLAIKTMEMQAGQGAKHIQQYVPSGAAGAPTVSNW
jgi:hypothetical protein